MFKKIGIIQHVSQYFAVYYWNNLLIENFLTSTSQKLTKKPLIMDYITYFDYI